MLTDTQNYALKKLNQYYPHWKEWYKWEHSPFSIRQKHAIEVCLDKERPYSEMKSVYRISNLATKRTVLNIIRKIDSPKVGLNYLKFVEQRIDTRKIPAHLYSLFMDWYKALEAGNLKEFNRKHSKRIKERSWMK